MSEIVKSMHL
jgi:hypothetical protein